MTSASDVTTRGRPNRGGRLIVVLVLVLLVLVLLLTIITILITRSGGNGRK